MIVVKIEMWPHGDSTRPYDLGCIEIANCGGTRSLGTYNARLLKSASHGAKAAGVWKRGIVEGFPRLRLGAYDLLFRVLAGVLGTRNPDAHEAFRKRLADIEAVEGPDVPGQLLLGGDQ